MTLNEMQKIFPDATAETWHQHGNGGWWVQNTCTVEASVYKQQRRIFELAAITPAELKAAALEAAYK